MIELAQLVTDFAVAVQQVDARGPQAVSSRTKLPYRPGIGPHGEVATLKLVIADLIARDPAYAPHAVDVPYAKGNRQRCDWCLGSLQPWDWAIEVKMLRIFGDNGKLNDNMLMHVLSPYPAHHSALTDCPKLAASGLARRKAAVIFGYDYDGWPMEPTIAAFERLASEHVSLGRRCQAAYDHLVHPVHKRGHVCAWEVTSR